MSSINRQIINRVVINDIHQKKVITIPLIENLPKKSKEYSKGSVFNIPPKSLEGIAFFLFIQMYT